MNKISLTPNKIAESWKGLFRFKKEADEHQGLRSPQIGALHALLSHTEDGDESAIVVMPTGTGKTETMLAFLIANTCQKVFVIVPSDALRTQTYRKFKTLGLLRKLEIVPHDINLPIVTMVKSTLDDSEWKQKIDNSNVIITTMSSAGKISSKIRTYLRKNISFLFVDEAHHSKAQTWDSFINVFPPQKVIMFTATPFRNDGQKLSGKIVFNFSLKKAQDQGYYQKIKNYQITKYSTEESDKAIAAKAITILNSDLDNGFDHIVMARCKSKKRAEQVFNIYKQYQEYSPVIVYSGMRNGLAVLKAIKEKKHRIIVCVNMLGEGYDLPQLKIAAIHDERQSLAITLQFIGRFTRTNDVKLGPASFITNIAYPPIQEEINTLYQTDADWNCILPRINEKAATKQQSLSSFLKDFQGDLKDEISLEDIRPALSAEIYATDSTTTSFTNWKKALNNSSQYDYILHSQSSNTLIIVLGKKSHVLWGDTHTVQNLNWDIVIVYFDSLHKRIYLNSSINIKGERYLKHLFSNPIKYQDDKMFRVFSNILRLRLFNVGARLPRGKDISFQSYYGSSVQDGIDQLSQGRLEKNNLFGVGYKNGQMTSIGCSSKGKVWSRERADLQQFQNWCKEVGKVVSDETIDSNVVLKNTLVSEHMSAFPEVYPISMDWNPEVYVHYTQMIQIADNLVSFDEIEISVEEDTKIGEDIVFSLKYDYNFCKYRMTIENNKAKYTKISGDNIIFYKGNMELSLEKFLEDTPMTVFYADDSVSYGVNYYHPQRKADEISDDLISTFEWENVDLSKESQHSKPYEIDSIQYYMAKNIISKYDYLIDDDGSGEIADLVAITNSEYIINITLYHLKYARGGKVSNSIENLYQVCGQAQKSIRWKYVVGQKVFDHILKRSEKKEQRGKSSSILKGSVEEIIKLREEASNKKEVRYHVVIVQPGMSKSQCSHEMKILLGNTVKILHEMANIDCRVICSR
ncbi:DEAD/DEAH box helicase family protein [Prevotella salivae]|jgi:possible helicase|uniref:DEAD/DEAH box helicase n=1 Tax=Segatella salivae TaxID=228604 RepID=UPI001C5FCEDC|nr:DEAD/DEAH box helicase family protein [Segatella salivae]MBW4764738.1 DEAD/DEAH box helicase family protein [Segatella salivae]